MDNPDTENTDMNQELMLDGNAVAGLLYEVFGVELTNSPGQCANCGHTGELATLLAFTQAPGATLRCPVCKQAVIRIVQTPDAIYLDARGAAYIRLSRPTP
jgi:hypothetical protein